MSEHEKKLARKKAEEWVAEMSRRYEPLSMKLIKWLEAKCRRNT